MAKATPLRVLVAGIDWPPETFLQRLILGLANAGIDVTIASSTRPAAEPALKWIQTPRWNGPHALRLARLMRMSARALFQAPSETLRLMRELQHSSALRDRCKQWNRLVPFLGKTWDVIYFPWNSTAISCLPLFNDRRPVVVSCRGSQTNIAPYIPGREGFVDGLRATFERCARVHCVSENIALEAEKHGLNRRKVRIIRPAVDPAMYAVPATDRRNDDVLRLITVGSLIWKKGLEYMLQSVALLRERGIRTSLDIVGDGIDRLRVVYTIRDLNLDRDVTLHGRKDPTEVARMLAASDVFLLSSLSEGISNAVLEAMASGLPVVTTDCGGMREAVTDGMEGLIVPPRDPNAMARAIATLGADPELRAQMGRAGRERVLKQFTLEAQIAQWIELIESVAV